MNYYAAREMMDAEGKPTGRFHYTCQNGGQTWAVGNCSPVECCPKHEPHELATGVDDCDVCHGKRLIRKANPCLGHATKDEACEHYRQYLIEHARIEPKREKWPKEKCDTKECEQESSHIAFVDSYLAYNLCPAHANKETLATLVHVGWSASS